MYSYLRGVYKGPAADGDSGTILIEVAGVGYEVVLPPIVEQEITATCKQDEPLLLYVSAQAGRDQPWPILFGFLRPQEKAFWELLKSVPRVGGKGAARAMAVPISRIAEAIQQGNKAFLDSLPGVTLEGAEKMIASLRKKVGPFVQPTQPVAGPRPLRSEADEMRDDAVSLLVVMGVKRLDAMRAVDQLVSSRPDITSVQDIITEYFRTRHGAVGERAE
jgi:Holliday junction DNA helicase RuvA